MSVAANIAANAANAASAVAAVAAANSMKENGKQKGNKENTVKEIIVTYEDGSARTIKHGFATEAVPEEKEIRLDYKNCTDDQFLNIVCGLAELAKEKGLLN